MTEDFNINQPTLPRCHKHPRRYDEGSAPVLPETPKDLYRISYFEALDLVKESIKTRFNQPGYQTYKNLQEMLIKAARGELLNKSIHLCVAFMEMILILYASRLSFNFSKLHSMAVKISI